MKQVLNHPFSNPQSIFDYLIYITHLFAFLPFSSGDSYGIASLSWSYSRIGSLFSWVGLKHSFVMFEPSQLVCRRSWHSVASHLHSLPLPLPLPLSPLITRNTVTRSLHRQVQLSVRAISNISCQSPAVHRRTHRPFSRPSLQEPFSKYFGCLSTHLRPGTGSYSFLWDLIFLVEFLKLSSPSSKLSFFLIWMSI